MPHILNPGPNVNVSYSGYSVYDNGCYVVYHTGKELFLYGDVLQPLRGPSPLLFNGHAEAGIYKIIELCRLGETTSTRTIHALNDILQVNFIIDNGLSNFVAVSVLTDDSDNLVADWNDVIRMDSGA